MRNAFNSDYTLPAEDLAQALLSAQIDLAEARKFGPHDAEIEARATLADLLKIKAHRFHGRTA